MKNFDYITLAKGTIGIISTNLINVSLTDIEISARILINLAMGFATIVGILRKNKKDKKNE